MGSYVQEGALMGENKIPVALQLYTVRDVSAKDYVGTLKAVAKMGYAGVELDDTAHGLSAAELKKILDDLGLRIAGAHVGFDRLAANLQAEIDFALELGNPCIVLPSAPEEVRANPMIWQAFSMRLDSYAWACHQRELDMAYHNHAFEFHHFNGRTLLDLFYTHAPRIMGELDVYWAAYAGQDPAEWLRSHPGRCPLIHLKDMTAGAERTFAEVGEGTLDFRAIFAAAQAQRTDWYIVEQDRCARPSLESAELSLKHLREWGMT
jgi:sugar phosphate isomerase/epimerase